MAVQLGNKKCSGCTANHFIIAKVAQWYVYDLWRYKVDTKNVQYVSALILALVGTLTIIISCFMVWTPLGGFRVGAFLLGYAMLLRLAASED
jgi:hypothetical protein